jgi:hypothetical protein
MKRPINADAAPWKGRHRYSFPQMVGELILFYMFRICFKENSKSLLLRLFKSSWIEQRLQFADLLEKPK